MQPYYRPPKPSFEYRAKQFIALLRRYPVLIIPTALVLLTVLAFVGSAVITGVVQDTQSPTPTATLASTVPQVQATQPSIPPTATATPIPRVNTQAVTLGGTEQAFEKKYGSPFRQQSGSMAEFQSLGLDVSINYVDTNTSNPDPNSLWVYSVGVTPLGNVQASNSQSWSATTAKNLCLSFLPPDAKFVKTVPSNTQAIGMGVIEMYSSSLLAHTIPASYFTDYNNNLNKPGTIYVQFDYHRLNDLSQVQSCSIATDTSSN